MHAIFISLILLVAYHLFLYPLLLGFLAARTTVRASARLTGSGSSPPSLTIIVPAYNEERWINAKIDDLVEAIGEEADVTVVLACDGCTDRTAVFARDKLARLQDERFILHEYHRNRGKIAVLNDEIGRAKTDIILLNDASARLGPYALRECLAQFADQAIGVVAPSYRVVAQDEPGQHRYWSYQIAIKAAESRLGSVIGPHGACYLFRRSLWTPVPLDTINDDFILPMSIVANGARAVYLKNVGVRELELSNPSQDFWRRVRIGAGNLQQTLRLPRLANPALGWTAFTYLSGKALRGVLPLLALGIVVIGTLLASRGWFIYQLFVLAIIAGLLLAAATAVPALKMPRALMQVGFAIRGLVASTLGCLFLLSGRPGTVWKLGGNRAIAAPPTR